MPTDPPASRTENDPDDWKTLVGLRGGLKVFGRYTLERILGRGGMGVVWLARDEKLDLEVALKFLPESLANDEAALDDLRRETRRCMKLNHPHIVRVYDLVEGGEGDTAAIAMEYVEGKSLTGLRLEMPNRVFEVADIATWIRQVCEALEYAHTDGKLVHRDLKPANLMIDARGNIRVMDFGIASSLSDSLSRNSRKAAQAQAESPMGGTLPYLSPQQLMGYPPSVKDDVYSLGATIYELLTSKPPFFRGGEAGVTRQIETLTPPTVAERRKELEVENAAPVPAAWEQTIAACLEKEAERRPRNTTEVWAMLSGAQKVAPATPPASKPFRAAANIKALPDEASEKLRRSGALQDASRKKPVLIAAVILTTLFVSAAGWWFGIELPKRVATQIEAARITKVKADAVEKMNVADKIEAYRIAEEKVDAEEKQKELAAEAARKAEEVNSPSPEVVTKSPKDATRFRPYENVIGMRFIPLPYTNLLVSQFETRVSEFERFLKSSGHDPVGGETNEANQSSNWRNPGFAQNGTHPVVGISADDAILFCRWLTKEDQMAGRIGGNDFYGLPIADEWPPFLTDGVAAWNEGQLPPLELGNIEGSAEAKKSGGTMPVGSFAPNKLGLYDVEGNVREFCAYDEDDRLYVSSEDPEESGVPYVLSFGGSFASRGTIRDDNFANSGDKKKRFIGYEDIGFRCVLIIAR